ncbi:haloacid dehalogenase-like hydrolase domain-containing protein At2g33255 [Coffea arabica]|uniref:Haloacid dehalogenase-like hydrolase domain-containing protein At2g33255 n=1 Tax=Coffea arabica TaxID=13443 RepID=A0A6P6X157_COFAR|nr:haloacid dehalogenase-like hydrolase domain-containing protein At2g33255 [Coffea arabica]
MFNVVNPPHYHTIPTLPLVSAPNFHQMPLLPALSRAIFSSSVHPLPRSFSSMSNFVTPSSSSVKARLRGVVFDMDGTLTVPAIDFPAMYKAVLGEEEYVSIRKQKPSGIDILQHIEDWSPDKQRQAYEIIADYEKQGLDRLEIMPGASELCAFLDSRSIRRGLITRNVKTAVDLFHERFGITFSPALSREFRPYKPDPAPLLHICSTWEVRPSEVMMIGDSLKDDVACGNRAGTFTCLLDETGKYDSPKYEHVEYKPDYKVSCLAGIHSLLEANFELAP